jgi:sortase A
MDGTAAPGAPGHSILSGHRDTHFRFLEDLEPGDSLRVQGPDGAWRAYRVGATEVIDARRARLLPGDATPRLTLVTCYPFDAIVPGGPLRYVVSAEAEAEAKTEVERSLDTRDRYARSIPGRTTEESR